MKVSQVTHGVYKYEAEVVDYNGLAKRAVMTCDYVRVWPEYV